MSNVVSSPQREHDVLDVERAKPKLVEGFRSCNLGWLPAQIVASAEIQDRDEPRELGSCRLAAGMPWLKSRRLTSSLR